jgi:putative transposase
MVDIQFTQMVVLGYPQACNFLHLNHRLHSSFEKSLIERIMQYFKDRTESFDDYYPCNNKQNCDLTHVYNWLKMFIYLYNTTIRNKIPFLMMEVNSS